MNAKRYLITCAARALTLQFASVAIGMTAANLAQAQSPPSNSPTPQCRSELDRAQGEFRELMAISHERLEDYFESGRQLVRRMRREIMDQRGYALQGLMSDLTYFEGQLKSLSTAESESTSSTPNSTRKTPSRAQADAARSAAQIRATLIERRETLNRQWHTQAASIEVAVQDAIVAAGVDADFEKNCEPGTIVRKQASSASRSNGDRFLRGCWSLKEPTVYLSLRIDGYQSTLESCTEIARDRRSDREAYPIVVRKTALQEIDANLRACSTVRLESGLEARLTRDLTPHGIFNQLLTMSFSTQTVGTAAERKLPRSVRESRDTIESGIKQYLKATVPAECKLNVDAITYYDL